MIIGFTYCLMRNIYGKFLLTIRKFFMENDSTTGGKFLLIFYNKIVSKFLLTIRKYFMENASTTDHAYSFRLLLATQIGWFL